MGPIDRFFERAGLGTPPKKKTFYQKYKGIIQGIVIFAVVLGSIVAFAYIFNLPLLLSK